MGRKVRPAAAARVQPKEMGSLLMEFVILHSRDSDETGAACGTTRAGLCRGDCRNRAPTASYARDWLLGGTRLLDEEAVLSQIGALHLFPHPHGKHAPASPRQAFIPF